MTEHYRVGDVLRVVAFPGSPYEKYNLLPCKVMGGFKEYTGKGYVSNTETKVVGYHVMLDDGKEVYIEKYYLQRWPYPAARYGLDTKVSWESVGWNPYEGQH